jgi:hypothetical protein
MKKIIISLYVIMNISYCTSDILTGKKVDTFKMDVPASLFYALIYTRERYSETRVIDMKDGTLKVAKYDVVTGIFGQGIDKEYEQNSYLVKKCVQGQVYRPVENDCRGKGTQDNWWGAEKYQWCATDDRSCEKESIYNVGIYWIDESKSPAAITCKKDQTNNLSWKIYSNTNDSVEYFPKLYTLLNDRRYEIPQGIEDYFWIGDDIDKKTTELYTNSVAFAVKIKSPTVKWTFKKSEQHYVLCIGATK